MKTFQEYLLLKENVNPETARVAHSAITKMGYGLGRPKIQGSNLVYNTADPEDATMIADDIPKQLAQWGINGTATAQGRDIIVTLNEGLGRFLKGLVDSDYANLPADLQDIYDSLDSFQKAHVKQLMQYNHMTFAQALGRLPNISPKLQWKLHNRGGTFSPKSSAETPAGWKQYR